MPPLHPREGQPFDLAFELTTDEVATNAWSGPIVITAFDAAAFGGYEVVSLGDAGSGVQILQSATNLLGTNWVDITTNMLPWQPPLSNVWIRANTNALKEFFRVIQR